MGVREGISGKRILCRLPKVISEMVGQTCRFPRRPAGRRPPFRKFLLAITLIQQVRTEIRNLARLHVLTPVVQFAVVHFPKIAAEVEVLQHNIPFSFFE